MQGSFRKPLEGCWPEADSVKAVLSTDWRAGELDAPRRNVAAYSAFREGLNKADSSAHRLHQIGA